MRGRLSVIKVEGLICVAYVDLEDEVGKKSMKKLMANAEMNCSRRCGFPMDS